jgi:hypothetical protein
MNTKGMYQPFSHKLIWDAVVRKKMRRLNTVNSIPSGRLTPFSSMVYKTSSIHVATSFRLGVDAELLDALVNHKSGVLSQK